MDYSEEDFLSLAGIQHFVFCRRQWALIHIEQQWKENIHTMQGNIFHENAHNGTGKETRKDTVITRGLPVFSHSLGISGICDVVEFQKDKDGIEIAGLDGKWAAVPIEYKKGKPKADDCDILQLAAQAVCLEEMLLCHIERGFLFYGETRHRTEVKIDSRIRQQLRAVTEEMHDYYAKKYTPKVKTAARCRQCSLNEICMPVLCGDKSAKKYISRRMKETQL